MFLDTNVTHLLKKKLGSPNSFLKKTRKTAIFSASLVLPLFAIVVMETRLSAEFFLFATRLTICVTIISPLAKKCIEPP